MRDGRNGSHGALAAKRSPRGPVTEAFCAARSGSCPSVASVAVQARPRNAPHLDWCSVAPASAGYARDPRRVKWRSATVLRVLIVSMTAGCVSLLQAEARTREMSPDMRRTLKILRRIPSPIRPSVMDDAESA